MDINLNYSEGDTPIALKSDFILSFCELIMGGKNGLEAVEKTLIDRAVISVYRNYLADPKPENMPILGRPLRRDQEAAGKGSAAYRGGIGTLCKRQLEHFLTTGQTLTFIIALSA